MTRSDSADGARQRYEQKTAALVGQRIAGVTYWDVYNYSSVPRRWDHGDWHHAVMGVELQTDGGPVSVLWTNTFHSYGVEVFCEPISQHLRLAEEGPEGWSVEDHQLWRFLTASPVQGIATYWEQFELGPSYRHRGNQRIGEPRTLSVPVALRLDFERGSVWMIAAIPESPDTDVFVGGDEIMVVFSLERMRKIGFPNTAFIRAD